LIGSIEGDLGGSERLSTAERQLVQRAAIMGAAMEDLEARWLAGEPSEPVTYATSANAQKRLLEAVGLKRREQERQGEG
jgi:hypothetical protein